MDDQFARIVTDLVGRLTGPLTLRLYLQPGHESPGKNREPNWLPAPKGPFFMVLREYWPKPEALDGSWKAPQALRVTK